MTVTQLGAQEAAALRAAPFTYAAVGGLSSGRTPAGFSRMRRSRTLHRRDFDAAAAELMAWGMQSRAGLRVEASEVPLQPDTVVLLRLGPGPVSLRIPCRVVGVIDEPTRRGFSYGTLPGHPEAGEEQFVLELRDDGRIEATVEAFSRPASLLARLGGPLGRAGQRYMASRYLAAIDAP
jgi:uncharacterized protein (UPF0548 family)